MARKELDRFETNYKKDIKIQTKLMGIFIASMVFVVALITTVVLVVFHSKQLKMETEKLTSNSTGAQRIVDDWKLQLDFYTYLFSINSHVEEAVAYGDRSALDSVTGEIIGNLDLDFWAITDASGKTLKADEISGDLSTSPYVTRALRGQNSWGYDSIGSQDYSIIAAYPVKHEGKIVGCVVFGYCLDNDLFTYEVTAAYGCECTVFHGNVRVDTTLRDLDGNKILGTTQDNPDVLNTVLKNGDKYFGQLTIAGSKYITVYEPVVSQDGSITGMLFIASSLHTLESVTGSVTAIAVPIAIGVVLVMLLAIGTFVRWLMWRIKNVSDSLEEMATGEADLTKRCKLFIRDEIGFLVINFDAFCDKLQQIISEIKKSKDELTSTGSTLVSSIDETSGAIGEISESIGNVHYQINNSGESVKQTALAVGEVSDNITLLDGMIQNQSGEVSDAATAVEEMIGNISSVNNSVEKMAGSFEVLAQNAKTGFSKQQDVNDRIRQIETQSEMLQEANLAISSIAEQTNLLAMNAAIEAAHAGEAGKGFSVVADEIRKLSETSSQQSKTIGEQLNNIKDSITEVVSASNESREAFAAVSSKIEETDQLVLQIKAAMEEQTSGSKQISQSLKLMNDSTAEVNKASKNMAQKNLVIQSEIKRLQSITEEMKDKMDRMASSSEKISSTKETLGKMSESVQGAISKIGSQIDLFKV